MSNNFRSNLNNFNGDFNHTTGFTPVGSLLYYDGATPPDNYLVCDGTVYNIADYPELANHYETQYGSKNAFGGDGVTTFAVRNLQGEFIRCAGTNSHAGQGSGGDVGEHQDSTEIPRLNTYAPNAFYIPKDLSDSNLANRITNADSDVGFQQNSSRVAFNGTDSTTTLELPIRQSVRPTNTSMLICVAYKNIYIDAVIGNTTTEITNPQDGQSLVYDAASQKWVNGAGGLHEYSTTEKVVGIWIDGRPIYEMTIPPFTLSQNTDSNWHTYSGDFPSTIDKIISTEGLFSGFGSGNTYCAIQNLAWDSTIQLIFMIVGSEDSSNTGKIMIQTKYDRHTITATITARYVKTTDTPTVQI